MKKSTKILIGILSFVVAATIVVFVIFSLTAKKEPIDILKFESVTIKSGYSFGVDQEIEKNSAFKNTGFAIDEEDGYQIEFYVLGNSNDARQLFEHMKADLETLNSTSISTTESRANYAKYSATTETHFLYATRIDNTVLYANVDVDDKDEVEKFIEEIGY